VTDSAGDNYAADNATPYSWAVGNTLTYTQIFHFNLSGSIASVTLNVSPNAQYPAILCSSFMGASSPYTVDTIGSSGTVSNGTVSLSLNLSQNNDGVFCGFQTRSEFYGYTGSGFALSSLVGGINSTNIFNQVALSPAAGPVSWSATTNSATAGMACLAFESTANAPIAVPITGGGSGLTFNGIGGVGGSSTRLLTDYPPTQQSQILDYLFRPNYGAAIQVLKFEIGSDAYSGQGSLPSYNRTGSESVIARGPIVGLVNAAKARNPNVKIYGLTWGTAGWVGSGGPISGCSGNYFSTNNINYLVGWVQAMENATGYPVDYLGGWNEVATCATWIKALYAALQSAGLTSTHLVMDDNVSGLTNWGIATNMAGDSALKNDIYAVGQHYVVSAGGSTPGYYPSTRALSLGNPLWDTEDGASQYGPVTTWAAAGSIAHLLNTNYIQGSLTATYLWSLVTSYYNNQVYPDSGLMTANTPWSGNYAVGPAIWAVAHTTQFIQPGWQYLNSASSPIYSTLQGSYVTATNGTDYSVVIETITATAPQTFNFTVGGGLNTGTVYVWESTASSQFVQQNSISPSGGVFSFTAQPGAIYSLTTTTGQAKGSTAPPSAAPFPFPYRDEYQNYSIGANPLYMSDVLGAFNIESCAPGRNGKCLQQVLNTAPIAWPSGGSGILPLTVIGDPAWTNYLVSSDVLLPVSGTVSIYGRIANQPQKAIANGYSFNVSDSGAWSLAAGSSPITSGTLAGFGTNTWHTLQLRFSGATITALVDNIQVTSVTNAAYSAGQAGLGVGTFINAEYYNLQICAASGCVPERRPPHH
jgi:Glycosyl hydrolase family 59